MNRLPGNPFEPVGLEAAWHENDTVHHAVMVTAYELRTANLIAYANTFSIRHPCSPLRVEISRRLNLDPANGDPI